MGLETSSENKVLNMNLRLLNRYVVLKLQVLPLWYQFIKLLNRFSKLFFGFIKLRNRFSKRCLGDLLNCEIRFIKLVHGLLNV